MAIMDNEDCEARFQSGGSVFCERCELSWDFDDPVKICGQTKLTEAEFRRNLEELSVKMDERQKKDTRSVYDYKKNLIQERQWKEDFERIGRITNLELRGVIANLRKLVDEEVAKILLSKDPIPREDALTLLKKFMLPKP